LAITKVVNLNSSLVKFVKMLFLRNVKPKSSKNNETKISELEKRETIP